MARRAARFNEVAGKSQEKGMRPMLAGGRAAGSEAWNILWPRAARAWLRQYLLWRTRRRSKLLSPYHDAGRDGMPRRRQYKRRGRLFKWSHHTVAIGNIVVLVLLGCRRESQRPPEAVYSGIEKEFISGELSKAQQHSDEAYQHFESSRPDWAAPLRLELAKVLIYQGKNHDALDLLQQPLPAGSTIESEVNRKIFRSIAEAGLGHFDDAEKNVLEAERQCPEGPLRA